MHSLHVHKHPSFNNRCMTSQDDNYHIVFVLVLVIIIMMIMTQHDDVCSASSQ